MASRLKKAAPQAAALSLPIPDSSAPIQGPPRLLSRPEILEITGVTFPTIWAWMRGGTFPRSRIVGGRSMWRSDEIDAWMAALPVRPLKGDAEAEAEHETA
jgi:predicted DNA-binding transcriptional regulator AlpA